VAAGESGAAATSEPLACFPIRYAQYVTLVLTLGNSDQVIQVSDRRLSWDGKVVEDESSKAGVLTCLNARLAFGFTGLARWTSFRTRDWLLDALRECGPPDYTVGEILLRLKDRASDTFLHHPVLRTLTRKDKRLSIMFSGYLYHHDPPQPGFAIMTNFQNFQTGYDEPEAWDQFTGIETRPLAGVRDPTFIQRVGNWHAMTGDDVAALRELLEGRTPADAIIGKAVKLVRQMADRPAANKAIGKQLSVVCIPRTLENRVQCGYYSNVKSNAYYMPDGVILNPFFSGAFRDVELRKVGGPNPQQPFVVPKVGRNQPCPCASGKKYKHCHGKVAPTPKMQ
jgi:hypothetical protein